MPDVLIGSPQERPNPAEPYLRWWQVPVSTPTRRQWESDAIAHCRLGLLLKGPHGQLPPRRLIWPTHQGPEMEITLHVGEDPYIVPVVMRSEISTPISFDPVRLPHFALPARTARLSDANAAFQRADFADLSPSVWYTLTLQVFSGTTLVGDRKYRLRVPDILVDNELFTLREYGGV